MMKVYTKAILPVDFQASAMACGLKKAHKLDLALFYSRVPAVACCKFTSNKVWAAPLHINKRHLAVSRNFHAIIANSGNANCFNGLAGLKDAEGMAAGCAKALGIRKESVLVASTGIIGRRLPLAKIKQAVPELVRNLFGGGIDKAKLAIMTTDTFAKEITVKFNVGRKTVTICGVAKGAGMIAPDMATMLAFILTDACIAPQALEQALTACVQKSFNCITVDGCMSTNDSVMMLANSAAKNTVIRKGKSFRLFLRALETVCLELAKMIVKDAEGGTKFIQIRIDKARDFAQARKLALAVANSNLFKTAVYGQNPNFGRIVASLGSCGVAFSEKDIRIKVSPLDKKEIRVDVSVGRGRGTCVVYTSDLTPEYIKINAEYN